MKNLYYYIKKAQKEKFAIGQFNFSDFSQVKGMVQAAQNLKSPIILGTSEGESKFVGLQEAVAIRDVLRKKTGLPIFLNLDHGKSFEYIKEAVLAGYDMVHFDGSKLPLEENIKISKKVVAFSKKRGVLVEGEVGRFSEEASKLYQETFEIKEEDLTSAQEATDYINKTKVDLLAINIGTFHGIDANIISPHIKLSRLREITLRLRSGQKEKISIPLVLHGGSGTPEEDVREAIQRGITKININTETRLAFSNALRKTLEVNKDQIVPYKYLPEVINAVQITVEKDIKLFGSSNKV